MNRIALPALAALMLASPAVGYAQEAPAPHKAPRTPVHRQSLSSPSQNDPAPVTGNMRGIATVIDAEKLRIGDVEFRLFGVVPPQLSAAFGPQARAAVDALVASEIVDCQIRDRDRDGRYFATCKAGGTDIALDLLRRGLGVTARGSIASTELALPYEMAEQNAQGNKAGIWSLSAITPQAKATPEPVKATAKIEPPPAPVVDVKKPDALVAPKTEMPATSVYPMPQMVAETQAVSSPTSAAPPADDGWVARYQLLLSSLVLVGGAFGVFGAVYWRKKRDEQHEIKVVAGAIRGELQTARSVCITRAKSILSEEDDRQAAWPRLRTAFYQAYIGRVGFFGVPLARQIASIYGQAVDYASYYHSADEMRAYAMPKRQALVNLVHYIDEVLPRLAAIEKTGAIPLGVAPTQAALPSRAAPPMAELPPPDVPQPTQPTKITPSKTPETVVERKPFVRAVPPAPPVASAPPPSPKPLASVPIREPRPVETPQAASPVPFWNSMKKYATEPVATPYEDPTENLMPDYMALIEEEIAGMSFDNDRATDTRMGAFAKIRGV